MVGGRAWWGACTAGGHAWWGSMHDRGCMVEGCVWQGACMAGGMHAMQPPPVNRITDACKNITVSQTLFAGGKHGATPSLMPENCYFASYRYVGCALITLHAGLRWRLGVLCYIGIDLDLSKPKGMPFDLKLHTYSFTTKYINMAKA